MYCLCFHIIFMSKIGASNKTITTEPKSDFYSLANSKASRSKFR